MNFADNYARLFVVMSVLGLEAANTYFAKAEIIGGILPNLIAFGLFLVAIGYFLFTAPYLVKAKRMDNWPTFEAANRSVGTVGLLLFAGTTAYLVWQFKSFFGKQ